MELNGCICNVNCDDQRITGREKKHFRTKNIDIWLNVGDVGKSFSACVVLPDGSTSGMGLRRQKRAA